MVQGFCTAPWKNRVKTLNRQKTLGHKLSANVDNFDYYRAFHLMIHFMSWFEFTS